jgi:hypothetical protein
MAKNCLSKIGGRDDMIRNEFIGMHPSEIAGVPRPSLSSAVMPFEIADDKLQIENLRPAVCDSERSEEDSSLGCQPAG